MTVKTKIARPTVADFRTVNKVYFDLLKARSKGRPMWIPLSWWAAARPIPVPLWGCTEVRKYDSWFRLITPDTLGNRREYLLVLSAIEGQPGKDAVILEKIDLRTPSTAAKELSRFSNWFRVNNEEFKK